MASSIIPCGGFEIDNDSFEFSNGVLKAKAQEPSGGNLIIHAETESDTTTIDKEYDDIVEAYEDGIIPVILYDDVSSTKVFSLAEIGSSYLVFASGGVINTDDNKLIISFITVAKEGTSTVCTYGTKELSGGGSSPE